MFKKPELKLDLNISDSFSDGDTTSLEHLTPDRNKRRKKYGSPYDLVDRISLGPVKRIAKGITNNLLDLENDKKPLLDELIASSKLLVTHANRKFDIDEPNNPRYISFIYENEERNEIIKIFNYECSESADFMIIKEISYQIYAQSLMPECNFTAPAIKKYGKIIIPEEDLNDEKYTYNCLFYIIMEKLNFISLNRALLALNITSEDSKLCESLSLGLTRLNNCLKSNGLYHNDYHPDNIMIDIENINPDNIRIGLIDYGNADDTSNFKSWEYTCEKLIQIKNRKYGSRSGGLRSRRRHKKYRKKNTERKHAKKYTRRINK